MSLMAAAPHSAHPPGQSAGAPSQPWAVWLLAVLAALAFMDRQILAVLIEPIKQEFALTDWQVGLITGLGFSLSFACLALPLSRLADRRPRLPIVVASRALGGTLAALGALSGNAWALAATRAGGAISDAGAGPASMSMIADLVPPAQRSRAMSVFTAGNALGSLLALAGGAWLAQRFGWRVTLACVGLASVSAALVARWLIREPLRGRYAAAGSVAPRLDRGAVHTILADPVARWLLLGGSFALLGGYSFGAWNFTYLVRAHGLSPASAGLLTGAAALAAVAGGLMAGSWTDRLVRRDVRWQIGVPALTLGLAVPCGLAYLALPPDPWWAICIAVLAFSFFVSGWAAPVYAALSLVMQPQHRATASALLLLSGAVVGSGVGPALTGALSDGLRVWVGGDGLRWALASTVVLLSVAAWALLQAMPAYRQRQGQGR